MSIPSPKPSDTMSYSGTPAPSPTDAGSLATGGWANNLTSPPWWNFPNEVYQAVPACVRVILPAGSNPTLIKLGPQEYFVTLSLSGTNTVTLTPGMADAHQNPVTAVSPNAFAFVYRSRQVSVCTVNSNGLVTAVGRGECTVLIGSARNANLPFTNASPPSGLTGAEIYAELTVRVVA
jgi:hypothetical protein